MTAVGAVGWIAFFVTLALWWLSDRWWARYCKKSIAQWSALCEQMNNDWVRFCMRLGAPPSIRSVKPQKEPTA